MAAPSAHRLVPQILCIVVFAFMAAALVYTGWIALRYFGQIGV